MSGDLWAKAEKLAERPYVTEVMSDETTDGQPIYLARTPELEGCMAQGETIEEVVQSLSEARIDYIHSLLEDGLYVPLPTPIATTTTTASDTVFSRSNQFTVRRELPVDQIEDQEKPRRLYEAALIT